MKKIISVILLFTSLFCYSQNDEYVKRTKSKFSYIAGYHAIDDDDQVFLNPINFSTMSWVHYPSKAGVLYEIADPFIGECSISYLKLNKSANKKYVAPFNYYGIDFNLQRHCYWYKRSNYEKYGISANHREKFGSFYFVCGFSASIKNQISEDLCFNMSAGGGLNLWIDKHFAVNLQSVTKISLAGTWFTGNANLIQHSLCLIYKN